MSTYLESVVARLRQPVAAVLHGRAAGWAVAAIPVDVLLDEEQTVIRDPIEDPAGPQPCDPAHALVDGDKSAKKGRERIAKASPLVHISA